MRTREGRGVGVDVRADQRDLAAERAARHRVERELGGLADRELGEFALRHVDAQDQRVEVLDDEQRAVRAFDHAADRRHGVADLHDVEALGDGAVDRRADVGVGELQAREFPGRLRGLELVLEVVERGRADQTLLLQLEIAVVVALELAHGRLVERDLEPQLVAVEPREHLARLHALALVREHLADLALDLRHHERLAVGLDRRRAGVERRHVGTLRGRDLDRHGRDLFLAVLAVLAVGIAAGGEREGAVARRAASSSRSGRAIDGKAWATVRIAVGSRRSGGAMLRFLSVVVKYNTKGSSAA